MPELLTIPIASREPISVPAGAYLAFHSENPDLKLPASVSGKFMHGMRSLHREVPPALFYTSNGVNVEDVDSGEVYGRLVCSKEKNGNYHLHFVTDTPSTDTIIQRTFVYEGTREEAEAAIRELFVSEVTDYLVSYWLSGASGLLHDFGADRTFSAVVAECIRGAANASLEKAAELYDKARKAILDEVERLTNVLNSEYVAAVEAIHTIEEKEPNRGER